MNKKEEVGGNLKKFGKWLWNSESWLSYLIFLVLVFIIVKFIFLPGLGLLFGTSLPLAIVESSSMEHYSLGSANTYIICDKTFNQQKFFNSEEYWEACGRWYEQNANITKEQFADFKLKNGFRKGDLIIIFGGKSIEVGDVIIFKGGSRYPIIHRVISTNPIQTKGDHNPAQLSIERDISQENIIGTAVFKIPYLGWVKLFFVDLFQKIF